MRGSHTHLGHHHFRACKRTNAHRVPGSPAQGRTAYRVPLCCAKTEVPALPARICPVCCERRYRPPFPCAGSANGQSRLRPAPTRRLNDERFSTRPPRLPPRHRARPAPSTPASSASTVRLVPGHGRRRAFRAPAETRRPQHPRPPSRWEPAAPEVSNPVQTLSPAWPSLGRKQNAYDCFTRQLAIARVLNGGPAPSDVLDIGCTSTYSSWILSLIDLPLYVNVFLGVCFCTPS